MSLRLDTAYGWEDFVALCLAVLKGVGRGWLEDRSNRGLTLYVIVDDNTPVGIVGVREYKRWLYEITDLFVRPSFRRRGYGTKAVELALDLIASRKKTSKAIVYFTVVENNEPAKRIARKTGFTERDVIEKYEDDGNVVRFVVFERIV